MTSFDPHRYGPACASLLNDAPPTELGPGEPNRSAYDALRGLDQATLFPGRVVVDRNMADCCRSALWLLHNFLDDSHRISQDIETTSGSYWHGIMHRREPDFSNAKYWFRRVGSHPVYGPLGEAAARIAQADATACDAWTGAAWDAMRFVDLCEASLRGRGSSSEFCRAVAEAEWQLLFDHCYRRAVGDDAGA